MPKGYLVAHVNITAPDDYPTYIAANKAAFDKYGAKPLVRGGRYEMPEAPDGGPVLRHVVLEFESYDQALACYHSPEYAPALALRKKYAETYIVIVEGVA